MRRSVKTLPAGYRLEGRFDLSENRKLALWLNLLGLASLGLHTLVFTWLAYRLRPLDAPAVLYFEGDLSLSLLLLTRLIVVSIVMLLLHEAVHGLVFRLFNGEWGVFAFKLAYAYAAAPDWYMPRNQHLVAALSPYLGLSLLGLALICVVPAAAIPALLIFVVINAAGAVGDLVIVAWLLRRPATALVNDYGDGVAVYVPA